MSRATLDDIAKQLGVSPMTVSRALRGVGRVSDETRRRVRETALELGYAGANSGVLGGPAHRGKTEQRLQLLMLTGKSVDDPASREIASELQAGLMERMEMNGGNLEVEPIGDIGAIESIWRKGRFHGLLLRRQIPRAWVRRLQKIGTVVGAISHDFYPGLDTAYMNELRAAGMVAEHLRAAGHRRVLWFEVFDAHRPAELADSYFDREAWSDRITGSTHAPRYAAWSYIRHSAISPDDHHDLICTRDWRYDSLRDAIQRSATVFLRLEPRPTAIVTPSDEMAVEWMMALQAAGLRVPQDVSLVAYGGTAIGRDSTPAITAVKLPMRTIGRALPELVERRMANPDADALTLQFEGKLIDGESVTIRETE